MIAKVVCCKRCNSDQIVKNGYNAVRNPKYKCKSCGFGGVFDTKHPSEETKDQLIKAAQEGASSRSVGHKCRSKVFFEEQSRVVNIFYAVFVLLIVLAGNLMNRYSIKVYTFSTKDFAYSYAIVESKGRTMEMMLDDFQKWKSLKASRENCEIYRNFNKNYLLFWKWEEYSSGYYNFPFVERE